MTASGHTRRVSDPNSISRENESKTTRRTTPKLQPKVLAERRRHAFEAHVAVRHTAPRPLRRATLESRRANAVFCGERIKSPARRGRRIQLSRTERRGMRCPERVSRLERVVYVRSGLWRKMWATRSDRGGHQRGSDTSQNGIFCSIRTHDKDRSRSIRVAKGTRRGIVLCRVARSTSTSSSSLWTLRKGSPTRSFRIA